MVRTFIVITFLFLLTGLTSGQEESVSPSRCEKPVFFTKTAALRDMPVIPPEALLSAGGHDEVENTDRPGQTPAVCFTDPLWQSFDGFRSPGTFVSNFEGVGNLQYKIPPDTEGDVGPQHYLQMINMSFAVFDKEGNILYGPAANVTIWQGMPAPWSSVSNGDPIVLYDEAADRWLVSELSFPTHPLGPYYIKIAVSATGDPTGSWYLYGYEYDYFCDYPKFGVWHDGYYLTTNNNYWENNAWHFHAVGVSVFQRDSMLTGSPDAQRIFFDFYPNQVPWSVLPADSDGDPPPAGLPAYLAYLDEGNPDRITMYQVITDWVIPSHSSLQWMVTLLPEPFSGSLPAGIEQPENAPYLAPLSNRIMYRLQFRQFDGYHAMVTNHTVNRGDAVAAVRWYEFRDAGSGWVIHQQGTYSPDDRYRWMGSIAMDGYGNIALGYSVSSKEVYPSIRYTGRKAGDPPGVMTLAEEVIMEGYGVQLNPNHRWGDYSSMSVDPTDQCTFWYTQQYYEMTGDRSWQTRIAAFHIQDYPGLQVAAEPDSLCLGEEVQLYAIPAGGSGNYSYSWYSDPPGFYSSQQDPVDVPGTTTVYFCEVDDGVNQLSDQVTVFVQPPP
ncbi:MAG: hypothetical protein JW861_14250, partial [Bacteroidales bacterium]|nr:hypothetical protein [Bacteroidales bacterium]